MYRFILSIFTTLMLFAVAGCCLPPAQGETTDLFSQIDFPVLKSPGAIQPEYKSAHRNISADKPKKTNKIPAPLKVSTPAVSKKADITPSENSKPKSAPDYRPHKLAALGDVSKQSDVSKKSDRQSATKKPSVKANADPAALTLLRSVMQVAHPQSIIFDKKRLRFYVSRLGEKAADKKGAIALLARDGGLINKAYVKGLNQPRGLAIIGEYLYVADGRSLVQIDVDSAKVINRFEDKDAFYFNDVVASNSGEVFVTAPLTNSINKLTKNGKFELFLQDPKLSGPNSLAIEGDDLYVGSMGLKSGDPKKPGEVLKAASANEGGLFKISLSTKEISKISNEALPQISSIGLDQEGHLYAVGAGASELLKFTLSDGRLAERIDVQKLFKLSDTQGLGDFHYFPTSKEFWVPVKNNGHILVFVRSDATLTSENE